MPPRSALAQRVSDGAVPTALGGGRFTGNSERGFVMRRRGNGIVVFLVVIACAFPGSAPAVGAQVPLANTNARQRAASLLARMTLDEKIGQLNLAAGVALG